MSKISLLCTLPIDAYSNYPKSISFPQFCFRQWNNHFRIIQARQNLAVNCIMLLKRPEETYCDIQREIDSSYTQDYYS